MANMSKKANIPIGPGCENGQIAEKTRVAKMTKMAEKANLAKYSKKSTKTQMNKKMAKCPNSQTRSNWQK